MPRKMLLGGLQNGIHGITKECKPQKIQMKPRQNPSEPSTGIVVFGQGHEHRLDPQQTQVLCMRQSSSLCISPDYDLQIGIQTNALVRREQLLT